MGEEKIQDCILRKAQNEEKEELVKEIYMDFFEREEKNQKEVVSRKPRDKRD